MERHAQIEAQEEKIVHAKIKWPDVWDIVALIQFEYDYFARFFFLFALMITEALAGTGKTASQSAVHSVHNHKFKLK